MTIKTVAARNGKQNNSNIEEPSKIGEKRKWIEKST